MLLNQRQRSLITDILDKYSNYFINKETNKKTEKEREKFRVKVLRKIELSEEDEAIFKLLYDRLSDFSVSDDVTYGPLIVCHTLKYIVDDDTREEIEEMLGRIIELNVSQCQASFIDDQEEILTISDWFDGFIKMDEDEGFDFNLAKAIKDFENNSN